MLYLKRTGKTGDNCSYTRCILSIEPPKEILEVLLFMDRSAILFATKYFLTLAFIKYIVLNFNNKQINCTFHLFFKFLPSDGIFYLKLVQKLHYVLWS